MAENVVSRLRDQIADVDLTISEEMIIDAPIHGIKDEESAIKVEVPKKERPPLDFSMENTDLEKLEKRAQRFQSEAAPVKVVQEPELKSLYKSLGVDWKAVAGTRAGKVRLDAIHVRGVNNMSTEDILEYFKDYAPTNVEWVNDQSCNVMWLDVASPAKALLTLSQPIKKKQASFRKSKEFHAAFDLNRETVTVDIEHVEDIEMTENETFVAKSRHRSSSSIESDSHQGSSVQITADQSNTPVPNNSPVDVEQIEDNSLSDSSGMEVDAASIDIPIPPGAWRLAVPHPKARFLLVRFAYRSDRKVHGAEKLSQYYLKYGNPNYKGLKGIISTSLKRKLRHGYVDLDAVDDDDELKTAALPFTPESSPQKEQSKRPRMRMYADDEEEKSKRTYLVHGSQRPGDLRSKIGSEKLAVSTSLYHSDDSSDLRSRLTCKSPSTQQHRIATDNSQDLSRPSVIGDLRSKLEKLRQSRQPKVPLVIEIVQDDA